MEVMDTGTQLTFLWRLVRATSNGSIKWESTKTSHFRTRIQPFGYTIESRDEDDFAPYVFKIFKFETEAQDETPVKISESESSPYSPLNDALQALYAEVKRKTLGFDTLVGEMFETLSEIDGGSPIPEASPIPPSSESPF